MDAPGNVPESINCHSCGAVLDLAGQVGFTHIECKACGAASVVPLKFGDFLLLNVIGTGGTATVYKAIDVPLNRYVALKVLRSDLAADAALVANFASEARAAATINHPNIAQVYSFGEVDRWHYMTVELCEQGSLDHRLTKLGRLPEMDVLTIGLQMASALRSASQRGVLHRDVKPGNVLFNQDGVPKLVDFGLAPSPTEAPRQDGERIWGTPYYVAPEKLRGDPEDERSDIYSLGATLFHALAGQPPLDAAAAAANAVDPAVLLRASTPGVGERTARVVARMLALDPAERYGSYDEVVQDLSEAMDLLKEAGTRTPDVEPSQKQVSALHVVSILILCGGVIWFVWKYGFAAFHAAHRPPPTTTVPVEPTQ
ncbi:MAG TPA: serine/threonine-protein kinase [Verrucomicrobiae bacterium]|nr:serine/threonine-protein kinase [Verrucomicrobiae bacterium]